MPFHIVGWNVATTCLFMTGIVWGGTWRLRATYVDYSYFCALVGVRIYTCPYMCTQLKIHDIKSLVFLVPEVSLAQFYFLFDGPGMSFVEGIVCPQASQTCCDKNNSFHFHFQFQLKAIGMTWNLNFCWYYRVWASVLIDSKKIVHRVIEYFEV